MSVIKDIIGDSTCSLNFFKTVIDFNILSDLIHSYEFFLKKLRIILDRVKIDVYVASLDDNKKNMINEELKKQQEKQLDNLEGVLNECITKCY